MTFFRKWLERKKSIRLGKKNPAISDRQRMHILRRLIKAFLARQGDYEPKQEMGIKKEKKGRKSAVFPRVPRPTFHSWWNTRSLTPLSPYFISISDDSTDPSLEPTYYILTYQAIQCPLRVINIPWQGVGGEGINHCLFHFSVVV